MFDVEAAITGLVPSVVLAMLPTRDVFDVSAVFSVVLTSV